MNKIATYISYMYDYLKNGDLPSVYYSVKYVLNKTSHPTDRQITTSVGTFYCRKGTNDFQFANLYYEWNVKSFILDRLHTFSVFVEAGSCIGEYSILLAKKNKKCFAFEPVPVNVNTLEKNISLNNLQQKVTIFPFGLGAENGKSAINFNPVNTGASKLLGESTNGYQDVAEIRKLDDIQDHLNLKNTESVLIKMDIEGMEPEAIEGATEFIREQNNVTMVVEYKHSGEKKVREALDKIAKFKIGMIDEYNLFAQKIGNYEDSVIQKENENVSGSLIKLFTRHYN